MSTEHVILVDEQDRPIGTAEKLAAHEKGQLHRAFSVFVFRKKNGRIETLLQQRQYDKYHCGGLWSNSCCSHPRPGEEIIAAGERRLEEELGIQLKLTQTEAFQYIAHFDNGLTENEYDHVLIGFMDEGDIPFNTKEVSAVKWMDIEILSQELKDKPEHYTPWCKAALVIAQEYVD